MRKIVFQSALCLASLVSMSVSAETIGDVRITNAFVEGNKAIITTEVYADNREWKPYGHPQAGLFWGDIETGVFYKLKDRPGSVSFNDGGIQEKISILSGEYDGKEQYSEMTITAKYQSNDRRESQFRAGTISVECKNGVACFRIDNSKLVALNDRLRRVSGDGGLTLKPLPSVRKIEYVFQSFENVNRFLIIDSSRLEYTFESFQVMVSESGIIVGNIGIKAVKRLRDGGTTMIYLENGTALYTPSTFKSAEGSKLIDLETKQEKIVKRIEQDKITPDFLLELGLPEDRYVLPALRTPCENVLKQSIHFLRPKWLL